MQIYSALENIFKKQNGLQCFLYESVVEKGFNRIQFKKKHFKTVL